MAREIPYIQALGEAVHGEMARDDSVSSLICRIRRRHRVVDNRQHEAHGRADSCARSRQPRLLLYLVAGLALDRSTRPRCRSDCSASAAHSIKPITHIIVTVT